jgi:hypothetical protein
MTHFRSPFCVWGVGADSWLLEPIWRIAAATGTAGFLPLTLEIKP